MKTSESYPDNDDRWNISSSMFVPFISGGENGQPNYNAWSKRRYRWSKPDKVFDVNVGPASKIGYFVLI